MTMANTAQDVKTCCADLYGRAWLRLLLGESFHPGGTALTGLLGERIGLSAADVVLDVASGTGASALYLAQQFGCRVVGVDLSAGLVAHANDLARQLALSDRVTFQLSDAEELPFHDEEFSVVFCECALCTFPNKLVAAREFARVLKPSGRLAVSDVALEPSCLPASLSGPMGAVACLADARPVDAYVATCAQAGFANIGTEDARGALMDMVKRIETRLLVLQVASGLGKIELGNIDLKRGRELLKEVRQTVLAGAATYVLLWGERAGDRRI
jgi:SAM-dependent methyltransferase